MKRLLTTLKDKWPEYLVEGIVIIASILIAIELENWNEERKERASEKVILHNLKEELVNNLTELREVSDQHDESYTSLFELLNLFENGYAEYSEGRLDSLFLKTQAFYTFEPTDGYMKSIISSGKIDDLQSEKLKSMITAFEGRAIDATQEVFYVNKLIQDRFWVRVDGNFSQVNAYNTLGFTETKGYPSNYEIIFNDHVMQDILSHIGAWQTGAQEDEEKLRWHIEQMIELVDAELKDD